jgi:hypothetical protein
MVDCRVAAILALLLVGNVPRTATAETGTLKPPMCSLKAPGFARLRDSVAIAFVGTAGDDTVPAGPGLVQYGTGHGHFGPGTPRAIYGQRVRVERLERVVSPTLRDAMTGHDSSVVLVPWDYAADCSRVVWNRSARWMPPGTTGAFVLRPRARAHWADDRPTFDVIPEVAIYPPMFPHQQHPARDNAPRITAEDFLTLYELLPDQRSLYADSVAAMAPLVDWAEKNPDRAARLPIVRLISFMRWEARMHQYRSKASAIAGTYRIVYRVPSGDSAVIFARTELNPTSLHIWPRFARQDTASIDTRRPIGHALLVEVARTVSELPLRRRDATSRDAIQGYITVTDSALATAADSAAVPGSIDLHGQAARLAPDSATAAAIRAGGSAQLEMQRDTYQRGERGTIGRFVLAADGTIRYQLVIERDGVRILSVSAQRISRDHLRVLWPPQ